MGKSRNELLLELYDAQHLRDMMVRYIVQTDDYWHWLTDHRPYTQSKHRLEDADLVDAFIRWWETGECEFEPRNLVAASHVA